MKIWMFLGLLILSGCTGEWGDWMQDKDDEDTAFFCGYYKNCDDKSAHDALYGSSGGDSGATSHSSDTAHVDSGADMHGGSASHDSGNVYGSSN